MRWIDVFGPPGVGKSTLCDHLWAPHAIEWQSVTGFPGEWDEFIDYTGWLMDRVKDHPSFNLVLGMVNRSFKKMAAVHRRMDDAIYVQTGFAQRGLGFGWRLKDPEDIRRYYELMPVSLGVVSLYTDEGVIIDRNKARTWENRAHMVPLMARPREIAVEVMKERGVPLLEIDTRQPIANSRKQLTDFRDSISQSKTVFHAT